MLSAAQLQQLVDQAGAALQRIQNELGPDGVGGTVAFPRGYLSTLGAHIRGILWIGNSTLARNLCYHLIFGEVLRWLLNRTDLYGVARGMVIKHLIALMGGIAESLTVEAMRKLKHGKKSYAKRVAQLLTDRVIDQPTHDELVWLWTSRSAIHVYEVTDLEAGKYEVKDSNRAVAVVRALSGALATRFGTAP